MKACEKVIYIGCFGVAGAAGGEQMFGRIKEGKPFTVVDSTM